MQKGEITHEEGKSWCHSTYPWPQLCKSSPKSPLGSNLLGGGLPSLAIQEGNSPTRFKSLGSPWKHICLAFNWTTLKADQATLSISIAISTKIS